MRFATLMAVFAAALALSSCAAPLNFDQPGGPRWAARLAPASAPQGPVADAAPAAALAAPAELRVVTFNVKFSREIPKAIRLLQEDPALHPADLVLLQEMDQDGVRQVASALGMGFVYYPATVHPGTGRLFGNAILSRWPLSDDRKLVLPHLGRFGKTQRIAVAATVDVAGVPIRVYSVHIATGAEVSAGGRQDQVRALIADADGRYERVIVGGDFNAKGLGRLFAERGYEWPTERIGWTCLLAATDHIFLRGVEADRDLGAGKVADNRGASDHLPVWALVTIPGAQPLSMR
jgi:endonuclease/exonuclease/phosphatase family metal-dependent hydrolase